LSVFTVDQQYYVSVLHLHVYHFYTSIQYNISYAVQYGVLNSFLICRPTKIGVRPKTGKNIEHLQENYNYFSAHCPKNYSFILDNNLGLEPNLWRSNMHQIASTRCTFNCTNKLSTTNLTKISLTSVAHYYWNASSWSSMKQNITIKRVLSISKISISDIGYYS